MTPILTVQAPPVNGIEPGVWGACPGGLDLRTRSEVTSWPTHRPIRGAGQALSRISQNDEAPVLTSLAR